MDAKQLRRAATDVKQVVTDGLYLCQEPREAFAATIAKLCNHVLATVREDDEEAITGEWLDGFAKGEAAEVWNIDTKKMRNDVWVISQKGGWELSWQDYEDDTHGEWPYLLKTRGQLRQLLAGLGVTAHEK